MVVGGEKEKAAASCSCPEPEELLCYNLVSFHVFVSLGAGAKTCYDVIVLDFPEAADSKPHG